MPVASREDAIERALRDPGYHRAKLMGRPLYWPQTLAVQMVEKAMRARDARSIAIRSARQTMKNECSALIHVRHLVRHQRVGGCVVRTAPTYVPQLVNSKLRLEREIGKDPLIDAELVRKREGNILQYGDASIQFLSTDPNARVEGATASTLLDIDEAHLVDKHSFEEKFGPMAAFFAPPIVMWGVAADKNDLLYEYLCHGLGGPPPTPGATITSERVLQFPAKLWCELRPAYAKHYEERVRKLGPDHPVILTQYDLVDIDNVGGFFKPRHIRQLDSGAHPPLFKPEIAPHLEYIAVIDIAGEAEVEIEGEEMLDATRDSTIARIIQVDHRPEAVVNGIPRCREVYGEWWIGKQLAANPRDGLPGQQERLLSLLQAFKVKRYAVDARGVGEQIAAFLVKRIPTGLAYKANVTTVSEDCYNLLGIINNAQLSLWNPSASAPAGPMRVPDMHRSNLLALRAETLRQCGWTGYEIVGHDQIRIVKPKGGGARHIDHVKALTYIPRVLAMDRPREPGMLHQPFSMMG